MDLLTRQAKCFTNLLSLGSKKIKIERGWFLNQSISLLHHFHLSWFFLFSFFVKVFELIIQTIPYKALSPFNDKYMIYIRKMAITKFLILVGAPLGIFW